MNKDQKQGKEETGDSDVANKVVVAVKASKEISKTAFVWALTHVVQPGDSITLLVVGSSHSSGRKLWSFPRFAGDCATSNRRFHSGTTTEQKCDITEYCSQMILQHRHVYDPKNINVKIKIVSESVCGAVAGEAKRGRASWVVFDKQLKAEEKRCMEELQCNIVVMKHAIPKLLRLNLAGSSSNEEDVAMPLLARQHGTCEKHEQSQKNSTDSVRRQVGTPTSSSELGTPFTTTEAGTSSLSSDPGTSPLFVAESKADPKKEGRLYVKEDGELGESCSDTESEHLSSASVSLRFEPWIGELLTSRIQSSLRMEEMTRRSMLEKFTRAGREGGICISKYGKGLDLRGNVREEVSLARDAPPCPPPLCSVCQHKAPVFGKPPRWFGYGELDMATSGFAQSNFLAEGGFGSVHRGILPDGRAIAVKQHKLASSQGDVEFCSEVEVLSCAQHRNVVMLIGFCIEDKRRLLVYEYICNGSLDSHLYGWKRKPLEWSARQKIAIGSARGLRYLHEECRVGCIVHRDMRPNNILLTHDYEPLVGDFGLARWQPNGDTAIETRVIGTFGYLAPEYIQSGQITEKADVYSFGVVLIELVTGRKAVDLNRPKGEQCVTEWARPLLHDHAVDKLIDPKLGPHFSKPEVCCMLHAASLCLRRDPHSRPRMSQILRVLEGSDMDFDTNCMATPGFDVGNKGGRIWA